MRAGETFEGQHYIPDLLRDQPGVPVFSNCTFNQCALYGPAVFLLGGDIWFLGDNNTMDTIHNPLKAVLWDCYEEGRQDDYMGAIRVLDSTFVDCTFKTVGFMGMPKAIAQLSDWLL